MQGAPNEEEIQSWVTVLGQSSTTWVVSTRSNETIADGFFKIKVLCVERGSSYISVSNLCMVQHEARIF